MPFLQAKLVSANRIYPKAKLSEGQIRLLKQFSGNRRIRLVLETVAKIKPLKSFQSEVL